MPLKSFRGLIADEGIERIKLSTNDGLTGYKIKKFQLMPREFGGSTGELESTVKIFSNERLDTAGDPVTPDSIVNFDDPQLLAVSIVNAEAVADSYPTIMTTVFDHVTINQDIYVTHKNLHADAGAVNYYIELEQVKLDLNEATVATLKDMRGRE